MILDQGIGAHDAQAEYFGLGVMWTWVSGESQAGATMVGAWSRIIAVHGNQDRIPVHGNQDRVET